MTAPLFHVFIERARSSAPGAASELARAIAARYGIPAAELEKRFAMGRFRVKGNVDRATADSFAADLASLGAVITVVAATDTPAPVATAQAMTLPSAPRVAAPAQDLGALSGEMPLTLATLDGTSDDEARSSRKVPLAASFGPPADGGRGSSQNIPLPASFGPADGGRGSSQNIPLPASFGPAAEPPASRSASRQIPATAVPDVDAEVDVPVDDGGELDRFAPPEMQEKAPELVLAIERPARKSATPPTAPPPTAAPPHATAAPAGIVASAPGATPRPRGSALGFLADEGTRFIVGVVLCVALGAVPALLIGSAREHSAFAKLDGDLDKRQQDADTPDEWQALDRVRASFVERKRSERQTIAITAVLMWAVISGGLAWLWFRKLDWDRLTR